MCGIVGYVGSKDAVDIIVSGLHRLEYRGYDSAGVAVRVPDRDEIVIVKTAGKISALETCIEQTPAMTGLHAVTGIGHTRWATHGEPNQVNAHPHLSRNGDFAIVHNGIIENYLELKHRLETRGYPFVSQTDSEVIAHLIEDNYTGDFRESVALALRQLEGTYGIAVLSRRHPHTLIAARKGSPIVVGVCDGQTLVASDLSAIASHTQRVIFMDDGDILTATPTDMDITSLRNVPVSRTATVIDWDPGKIEKAGYAHFMLKEIHEQPEAIANAIRGRLAETDGTALLSGLQMDASDIAHITRVMIGACGTSLYAGMVGRYLFEDFANIPSDVQQAAEFRYRNPIIQPNTLFIAISQSGETADTLAAVREAKRKGAAVASICNVVGSTIARETGRGVYLHAGPEIGVASTKAFSCQVAVLAMLALMIGRTHRLSNTAGIEIVKAITRIPDLVRAVLSREDDIIGVAEKYAAADNFFYIGRGYMYPAALEGALKLKEISYIHAEGYHAAELKHGPIALLERKVPVMVAAPSSPEKHKVISNMQECRARKSPVIAIATEGDLDILPYCEDIIVIPPCPEYVAAIPVVVAEQLFAYHVARLRGCPIDQPRNLAKSVTVE